MVTDPSTTNKPASKPLLRGVLHQSAAWSALGAGSVLVAMAPNVRAAVAAGVYALSLVALFTISAIYHRVHWKEPRARARMRRADHASIFILIAGTYTPISIMALAADDGRRLLIMIWAGAAAGVLLSLLWINAPKALTAAAAVAVGWMIVPYLSEVRAYLRGDLWLVLVGGIAYTVGAVVYAARRPNPFPRWFGYHEVFHALTLVGAFTHFVVILRMMR